MYWFSGSIGRPGEAVRWECTEHSDASGIVLCFPHLDGPKHEALQMVAAALLNDPSDGGGWLAIRRSKWFVNCDKLRHAFDLSEEFDWMTGEHPVEPSYEPADEPPVLANRGLLPRRQPKNLLIVLQREALEQQVEQPDVRRTRVFAERHFHPSIVASAQKLFVHGSNRAAVQQASIAFFDALRAKSGLKDDGKDLPQKAFTIQGGKPLVPINALGDETDRSEQLGVMYLGMGAASAIRNPVSHRSAEPDEDRTLEMLSVLSFLLRFL